MNFLGKIVGYPSRYDASLLQSIPRSFQRTSLNIREDNLPFCGTDFLTHYEISYLLDSGKPVVGILSIEAPANTPFLVESKSLKLYFNSLNMHRFPNSQSFLDLVQKDLDQAYGSQVFLQFFQPQDFSAQKIQEFSGMNLDSLEIELPADFPYLPSPSLLVVEPSEKEVKETWYSHLLKSNCLITGQPDWASVQISYQGPKINPESLLKYLIAFRQHQEFHEHCVERIFMDILNYCRPVQLSVFGRYTRRGGIDINPFRSTQPEKVVNVRHARQ